MENSGLEISPIGTVSFELKGSSKTASGLVTLRNSSIHQICYKVKSNVTKIPVKISPGSKGILEPNATVELNISFDPGKENLSRKQAWAYLPFGKSYFGNTYSYQIWVYFRIYTTITYINVFIRTRKYDYDDI